MIPGSRACTVLAMLALPGCASKWEVQNASPAEVIEYSEANAYLVTETGGRQVELRDVRVERDSLIGQVKNDPLGPAIHARLAIPLSGVKSIAVRKPDGVATTFWVATAGVFAVLIAFAALFASTSAT